MMISENIIGPRRSGGVPAGSAVAEFLLMITYKEIAFTAYAVTNIAKARKFYEGVLGLKPARQFGPNFVEYDIGRGTIAVGCAPKLWPPSRKGTMATLEVTDFEGALAHLKKKKVKPALGPFDNPMCRMVGVRDPDGNMIVLHQRKTAAEKRVAKKKKAGGAK